MRSSGGRGWTPSSPGGRGGGWGGAIQCARQGEGGGRRRPAVAAGELVAAFRCPRRCRSLTFGRPARLVGSAPRPLIGAEYALPYRHPILVDAANGGPP